MSMRLMAVIISAIFLLLVGLLMRFGEIFFIAGVLFVLPAISYVFAKTAVKSLSCTRIAPDIAREGEPLTVEIEVTGRGKLLGTIEVEDTLPEGLHKVNNPDVLKIRKSEHSTSAVYSAVAEMRGDYTVGPLRVRASDPLGFFYFTIKYPLTSSLLVLPSPLELEKRPSEGYSDISQAADSGIDGRGMKGQGLDFHGVREYNVGDELRRVHWRSTARHGRLNVVEFEQTRQPDTTIALDLQKGTTRGEGRFSTLEYAVKIASGMAWHAAKEGGMVRLLGSGIEGRAAAFGPGDSQVYSILNSLAGVRADRNESIAEYLTTAMNFISPGSKLVCITSSVGKELAGCLEMMSAMKGISVELVLLIRDTGKKDDDPLSRSVLPAGVGITVVECSGTELRGTVRYEYAV